jgi:hypothetical protein
LRNTGIEGFYHVMATGTATACGALAFLPSLNRLTATVDNKMARPC